MIRGVLKRLITWVSGNEDAGDDNGEDARFTPSILDASVRYAHGGSNPTGEREIAKVEEEARRLEEQRHEK